MDSVSTRLKRTKAEQKKFSKFKYGDVKPVAVFQIDKGVDMYFESNSEQSDSDQDLEKDEPHGKYAFFAKSPTL